MQRSTAGLLVAVALACLVAPLTADTQRLVQQDPVIGILTPQSIPELLTAFRQGLRDLGYVEGHNIAIEYRFADGYERLPELAAELVRLQVHCILADGTQAVLAAKHATTTIPIVFPAATDPVGQGLVVSLAQPGGNITGVTLQDHELMGKRLELLKEAVPGVTRVAYLWRALTPSAIGARLLRQETEKAAHTLGMQFHAVEVRDVDSVDAAFATIAAAHADALIVPPLAVFRESRIRIVDLAVQMRLPGMFPGRVFADAGGLMSYGPSPAANFYRTATYVDKILKGAKPGDLPVEQPTKFELVINGKTAKASALKIPPSLLARADEVIE